MRQCGDCQLCCKLVPVRELGKPANTRCQHQRHGKGCAIYDCRPMSCRKWSCQWLDEDDTRDLSRPDRSHYVIDMMPDFVTLSDNETGIAHEIPVIQVWIDSEYPDAHRDPALRDWLARKYDETGMMALVRSPSVTTALLPPAAGDGQWHELASNLAPTKEHSAADIARVMADRGLAMEVK